MKNTQKEILKLNNKKFDIFTKTIKEKADIFAEYSCSSINGSIKSSTFSSCLKVLDIAPIHKKDKKCERKLQASQHCICFIKIF